MGRPKGSKNKSTIAKAEDKKTSINNTTNVINTTKNTGVKKVSINNPTNVANITEITDTKKALKIDSKSITAKYECELCSNPIYDSPRIIRCTELTGFASYHRSIQDRYKVCNECGKEFNDVVEKWLIKKGAKLRAGYINKKEKE